MEKEGRLPIELQESVESLREDTDIINRPVAVVAALKLRTERARIRWVITRLRKQMALKEHRRCLGFDHIVKEYRNADDRPKKCRRCGAEGRELTQIVHSGNGKRM